MFMKLLNRSFQAFPLTWKWLNLENHTNDQVLVEDFHPRQDKPDSCLTF